MYGGMLGILVIFWGCSVESVLSSTGKTCFFTATTTLLTFYVYHQDRSLSYAPTVIMTHD